MPGKRENRMPNPRPALTFAISVWGKNYQAYAASRNIIHILWS